MAHQHKIKTSTDRGFTGPVTDETAGRYAQNQAAHGNIVRIDTCACGAVRRTNINGRHREYGRWVSQD